MIPPARRLLWRSIAKLGAFLGGKGDDDTGWLARYRSLYSLFRVRPEKRAGSRGDSLCALLYVRRPAS